MYSIRKNLMGFYGPAESVYKIQSHKASMDE